MRQVLKLAVVGLNMGRNHCRVFTSIPEFHLAAVCDIDGERLLWVKDNIGADAYYDDYVKMLSTERPDVVIIATPTDLHCSMTILASCFGAKGVYCEKPMAISMMDAHSMREVCARNGTSLMIGHQRRRTPIYRTMKRLMDEGAIGRIELIRGTCAGDFLSDATHTVDSIRYLLDDNQPDWVLASLHRFPYGTPLWGENVFRGRRYGHSVESGVHAVLQFPGDIRAEITSGSQWLPGRGYQDIEVFGSKGRLWRAGDSADPPLLLQNNTSCEFQSVSIDTINPVGIELDGGGHGANIHERAIVAKEFYDCVLSGNSHPMDANQALKTHEIVMAVYESAHLHQRIDFPLKQDRYPLDIMLERGEIK